MSRVLGKALAGLGTGLVAAAPIKAQELRDAVMNQRAEQLAALERQYRIEDRKATQNFQTQMLEQRQGFEAEQGELNRAARQAEAAASRAASQSNRRDYLKELERKRAYEMQDARVRAELERENELPFGLKQRLEIAKSMPKDELTGGVSPEAAAIYQEVLAELDARSSQRDQIRSQEPLISRAAPSRVDAEMANLDSRVNAVSRVAAPGYAQGLVESAMAPSGPPKVQSFADMMRYPPGTVVMTPNGPRTVPQGN